MGPVVTPQVRKRRLLHLLTLICASAIGLPIIGR